MRRRRTMRIMWPWRDGATWRDIEFAAQLTGVDPTLLSIIHWYADRLDRRVDAWYARLNEAYDLVDTCTKAATEAQAQVADLEQQLATLRQQCEARNGICG